MDASRPNLELGMDRPNPTPSWAWTRQPNPKLGVDGSSHVVLGDPSLAIRPDGHLALGSAWVSQAAPTPRTNPSATWRWGCHSQSGFLPRPKRQVELGSTPCIRVAQAPGGARVCPTQGQGRPCTMWRSGLPRARAGQPKRQVSFRRQIQRQVPTPHGLQPHQNLCWPFSSQPSLQCQMHPGKKTTQPLPCCPCNSVSRAGLPLHCSNPQCFVSMLQSTMLCVYVNSNRDTEPF